MRGGLLDGLRAASMSSADDDTDRLFLAIVEHQGGGGRHRAPEARSAWRILAAPIVVIALLLALVVGTLYVLTESLGSSVARVPGVFGTLDASARPPANASLTFLLVGTDSRSDEPTTGTDAADGSDAGSQRSDVLMLATMDPTRTSASVVSIPRDSWVDIPGHGGGKINAAYAFGGPPLLVQTVEKLTGVRVDHFAVIDFAGFQGMVDAVGGIDVQVAEATSNMGASFPAGLNHLDGTQALAYVRQRYDLPRGDIDRAQRQQNALRALLGKVGSGGIADPIQHYRLLDAVTRFVSVDDTLSNEDLRGLGLELSGLLASDVTFLGAPVESLGREGQQSVVYLDEHRSAELWEALRTDGIGASAQRNPSDLLGVGPP